MCCRLFLYNRPYFVSAVFLSVISLGPMMGFLLGALTTSTYVDLSKPDITPDDRQWLGAWWLGSLVLAVIIFFGSLPLMLFPRNLQTEVDVARHRRSRHVSLRSEGSDLDAALHTRAGKMRPMLQRRLSEFSMTSVKEVPRKGRSLLLNVVFVCQTVTLCCFQYCMAGLLPFLPKYLETQFHVDTFIANIITYLFLYTSPPADLFLYTSPLADLFVPSPTRLLWEALNLAAITMRRPFVHISITVYFWLLIYTAE
ncbi:Solute carrier organic anion transporter family member 74D [Lamellibrachia satsuma]|nr:Solute carrier organic anion transporter family member 74D [Lamellibrachia satsuma]